MIIYRPQRGGLLEAMKEAVEFENEEEMKKYIVEKALTINGQKPFDAEDIELDDRTYPDERIGWYDTRYVCVKRWGDKDYLKLYGTSQAIGYCATQYEK